MSVPAAPGPISSTDFYNLLAFTAATSPEPSLDRRNSYPSLDPSFLAQTSPDLDKRVTKILDALALICVRKGNGQVFAVAAEVKRSQHAPDAVRLTVAENKGAYGQVAKNKDDYSQTVLHLRQVWGILQKAAHKLHQHHRPPGDYKEPLPPLLPIDDDLYYELGRVVYAYSIEKFSHRIVKAQAFARELGKLLLPIVDEENEARLSFEQDGLYSLLALINFVAKECNANNIANNPKYLKAISNLWKACKTFFDSERTWLGKLTAEFPKFNAVRFERKVSKAVDIQSAIHTLLRMSVSKRMYRLFEGDIQVDTLKAESAIHKLPRDVAGWDAVLRKAVHDADVYKEDVWNSLMEKAANKYSKERSQWNCFVHCEVNIVNHFTIGRRPIPYIGVSKLSCRSCQAFMQVHNETQAAHFYTRGGSGNWYFPWKIPARFEQSVMQDVYENVRRELQTYLEKVGAVGPRKRTLSDSSCASAESEVFPVEKNADPDKQAKENEEEERARRAIFREDLA